MTLRSTFKSTRGACGVALAVVGSVATTALVSLSAVSVERDALAAEVQRLTTQVDSLTVDLESETARADANLFQWREEELRYEALSQSLTYWDGLLVGDVIYCTDGMVPAADDYGDGTSWAACM